MRKEVLEKHHYHRMGNKGALLMNEIKACTCMQ